MKLLMLHLSDPCMHHAKLHTLCFRKLLCDVVKIKVDGEERVNRITRGNGEDIIGVSEVCWS